MFCTSWSKGHNARVLGIVRGLYAAGLLEHYTLALQTLTEDALTLSNRRNLRMNRFQAIVWEMAKSGIPVNTELIWGLPGDRLEMFSRNLDVISSVFPSASIYGYTLLPGTEFFERREEYRLVTETLREVGNWELDYVIETHSYSRSEGMQGYFLITAHLLFNRGNVLPLTSRYIAMDGRASISSILVAILQSVLSRWGRGAEPHVHGLATYAERDRMYRRILRDRASIFPILQEEVLKAVSKLVPDDFEFRERIRQVLSLDEALAPVASAVRDEEIYHFDFDAATVLDFLARMDLPPIHAFEPLQAAQQLRVVRPGGPGDLLGVSLSPGTVRGCHAVVP
jgi:hypothetical protein